MRTTFPLAVVLALGIVMLMFQGSGFNALVQGSQSPGPIGDEIQERGNESAVGQNGNITGERPASDEGSLTGIIIDTAGSILNIISLVVLLPQTLQRLGFPSWFAYSIGSVLYLIAGVGAIQFITGRILR